MTDKKKRIFLIIGMISLLFFGALVSNYNSFNKTKNSCFESNGKPTVEKSFLAINWSVSCK
ncbi:hypothetical protein LC087_18045 [Bacillus carboniphilus]|uniref:Uncharacterized protein n=1 Tax=Bacillus carboniphilus TaxID=86663 RepID=A0ABY9JT45_9BACI|nr:hypothetical protein [Bacillus carboniphilus]WLR42561.1 hypothetical protein LC087_18045 [Bacillus carboniphilus]